MRQVTQEGQGSDFNLNFMNGYSENISVLEETEDLSISLMEVYFDIFLYLALQIYHFASVSK